MRVIGANASHKCKPYEQLHQVKREEILVKLSLILHFVDKIWSKIFHAIEWLQRYPISWPTTTWPISIALLPLPCPPLASPLHPNIFLLSFWQHACPKEGLNGVNRQTVKKSNRQPSEMENVNRQPTIKPGKISRQRSRICWRGPIRLKQLSMAANSVAHVFIIIFW